MQGQETSRSHNLSFVHPHEIFIQTDGDFSTVTGQRLKLLRYSIVAIVALIVCSNWGMIAPVNVYPTGVTVLVINRTIVYDTFFG